MTAKGDLVSGFGSEVWCQCFILLSDLIELDKMDECVSVLTMGCQERRPGQRRRQQ